MEDVDVFDWSEKRSIIVRRVDPIAIYMNRDGDIIIRQQAAHNPMDSVITVPAAHVYSVIEGLQKQIKAPFVPPVTAPARSSETTNTLDRGIYGSSRAP